MQTTKQQPKYTADQLSAIAEKLRTLPDPPAPTREHSKQEAVRVLAKEIGTLQKRGYTVEQVAEALTGAGLGITTATLRNYLTRAKEGKATPKRRAAREASGATSAPADNQRPPVDPSKATFTPTPDTDEI